MLLFSYIYSTRLVKCHLHFVKCVQFLYAWFVEWVAFVWEDFGSCFLLWDQLALVSVVGIVRQHHYLIINNLGSPGIFYRWYFPALHELVGKRWLRFYAIHTVLAEVATGVGVIFKNFFVNRLIHIREFKISELREFLMVDLAKFFSFPALTLMSSIILPSLIGLIILFASSGSMFFLVLLWFL